MKKTISILLMFFIFTSAASVSAATTSASAWTPDEKALTCQYIYVVNSDTGTVVYAKNADQRIFPASITKLMTAVLVMDKLGGNLDQTVTVQQSDINPLSGTGGSNINLVAGEQITVRQLLYGLLVASGSDAANVLGRVAGGSIDNFIVMMNDEAKTLGMTGTHYVNAHGLHDPDHYSTARDTYLLARKAMSYPVLREIVATEKYSIPATNKTKKPRICLNTNWLLNNTYSCYYPYCQGIKTGTTTPAGACLVSYATKSGLTYYCVTMGGPMPTKGKNSAFDDSKKLYQWVFANFTVTPLVEQKQAQGQVGLTLAWNRDHLLLYPDRQFTALVPKSVSLTKLKVQANLPRPSIEAPVANNQKVGTADIYLDGQKMGTVNLVTHEAVARSTPLYFTHMVQTFFSSKWFKIISVLLVALFLLFLILSLAWRRHVRQKKARHMKVNKNYHLKR